MMISRSRLGALLLGVAMCAFSELPAVPQPASTRAVIEWAAWDEIVGTHVRDDSVDYDAISEVPGLADTVAAIGSASLKDAGDKEILAFYINAYNALAVQGILRGRSPRSTLGRARYFGLDRYQVAGKRLSLHKLEHKRIRPLGEPRIHFAIVCASRSCPSLRSEAFTAAALDAQLEDQARRFINDPSKNRFDLERGEALLSKIFKWFAADFEAVSGSVAAYIADYVDDPRVAATLRTERLQVRFLDYDWSLNGRWGSDS